MAKRPDKQSKVKSNQPLKPVMSPAAQTTIEAVPISPKVLEQVVKILKARGFTQYQR